MRFYHVNHGSNRYKYAWADESFIKHEDKLCDACGRVIRSYIYSDDGRVFVLNGGKRYPDHLQFCGAGDQPFLASESLLRLVDEFRLTGIDSYTPVRIKLQKGQKTVEADADAPAYFDLTVSGSIDYSYPAMFLKKKHRCDVCGEFSLNRQRLYPEFLDPATWDGSDFCRLITIPGHVICSENVVKAVKKGKLKGIEFEEIMLAE